MRTTVRIPDELADEIESHYRYDGNMSGWLQEAARQRVDNRRSPHERIDELEERVDALEERSGSILGDLYRRVFKLEERRNTIDEGAKRLRDSLRP